MYLNAIKQCHTPSAEIFGGGDELLTPINYLKEVARLELLANEVGLLIVRRILLMIHAKLLDVVLFRCCRPLKYPWELYVCGANVRWKW